MTGASDRRRFLQSAASLAALAALRPLISSAAAAPRTAISIAMLPAERTMLERFRLAVDAGFAGVEMRTVEDRAEAERVRDAAERSGLRIHSVVNGDGRRFPLSSPDRDVVRQGVAVMQASLRNAKLWGAHAVSIVPSAAGPETSYQDAWRRSQSVIRERVLPLARDLDVVLAVEEVWDGFVLGPPEVVRYVDAFGSPWVKVCLDMDRVVFYAYPQDWIRALGSRLVNVRARHADNERSGRVDWLEVRRAMSEIAYDGWVTAEIAGSDEASLRNGATALRRHLGA